VVSEREIRAKLKSMLKGVFGTHKIVIGFAAPVGDQAKSSAEPNPSRRKSWILDDYSIMISRSNTMWDSTEIRDRSRH
jgi:hypothetical protein